MKHFFSCIASLAMLFISFCLVSCVVINDSYEPDPEPETYYYSIEVLGSVKPTALPTSSFRKSSATQQNSSVAQVPAII